MLTSAKYKIGYIDPPWSWKAWSDKGDGKSAVQHYDCMSVDDIAALPISEMFEQDAAIFVWVVQAMLPDALKLIAAWGFTFKTVAFAWVKIKGKQDRLFYTGEDVKIGMGYHTRAGFEQCWLATRGKGYERLSKGEPQVIFAPLREHSRKPDEVANAIVRLCGDVPRIEIFARTTRPGWQSWGNQTGKFKAAS